VLEAAVGVPSVIGLIRTVTRHWRAWIGLPGLAGGMAYLAASWVGPEFVAESRFMPQTRSAGSGSRLAGLAAQFGVNLGAAPEPQSPDFYAEVVKSRAVMLQALREEYVIPNEEPGGPSRGTLLDLLEIRGRSEGDRLRAGVAALRSQVTTQVDLVVGTVAVRTRAPSASLAVQINRRLLDLVNQVSLEQRRGQAANERRFVEERLELAGRELAAAENAVARFLERNRAYQGSPALTFELARLERRVDLAQQVYVSLAQAREQAHLDEVRTTPVIGILDAPEGSARPVSRRRLVAVAGVVIGTIMALVWVVVAEVMRRERELYPADFAHVRQQWSAALARFAPRRRSA
jgi:uncharacterized protein involved in exopolysaccharide biosynthesis